MSPELLQALTLAIVQLQGVDALKHLQSRAQLNRKSHGRWKPAEQEHVADLARGWEP